MNDIFDIVRPWSLFVLYSMAMLIPLVLSPVGVVVHVLSVGIMLLIYLILKLGVEE